MSEHGKDLRVGAADVAQVNQPFSFLDYAVRMYTQVGQELYELPDRAWWRRRKTMQWRQHYAMRIADEMEFAALTTPTAERSAPESGLEKKP